jgi:hypothetical protein
MVLFRPLLSNERAAAKVRFWSVYGFRPKVAKRVQRLSIRASRPEYYPGSENAPVYTITSPDSSAPGPGGRIALEAVSDCDGLN